MKPPIVIIPTYNRKEFILKHVKLLKEQTLVPDILVVDNGSTDGTVEALKAMDGVLVFEMGENLGPAGAYHAGQKYALEKGYEIIINADDDALPVDDDLIKKSVELIKKGARVVFQRRRLSGEKFQQVGVNWYGVFHRSVFEEVGIYNPLIPFFEDTDFELRMRKAGIPPADSGRYVDHPVALGRIGAFSYYYRLLNPLIIFNYHGMFWAFLARVYIVLLAFFASILNGPFPPTFYLRILLNYLSFNTREFKPISLNYNYSKKFVSEIPENCLYIAVGGLERYDSYHLDQLKKMLHKITHAQLCFPSITFNSSLLPKLWAWIENNLWKRLQCEATIVLTGNYHYLCTFLLDRTTYGVDLDEKKLFFHSKNNRWVSVPWFLFSATVSVLLLIPFSGIFVIKRLHLKKMQKLLFDFRN